MPKQFANKFLIDESVEYGIVLFLRNLHADVLSISEENPGIADSEVLEIAYQQQRILITNDLDFGNLVFKEKQKSYGVILIRLPFSTTDKKISKLNKLITSENKNLSNFLTVIAEKQTRFKPLPK